VDWLAHQLNARVPEFGGWKVQILFFLFSNNSPQIEKQRRLDRIKFKTQQLQVLMMQVSFISAFCVWFNKNLMMLQQIAFKNLVERNRKLHQTQGPPPSNSAIQLPFIIVNTSKKTVIDCSISSDK
jgi:hypothetical protein